MPTRYWVPMLGLREPAALEHVHASVSRWFDRVDVVPTESKPHNATEKPYSVSPCAHRDGAWGVEICVLTQEADSALTDRAARDSERIRLGGVSARIGRVRRLRHVQWSDLAVSGSATQWRVDLLSPTVFRTTFFDEARGRRAERVSPLPTVPAVLRAPSMAWEQYGPGSHTPLARDEHPHVWVSGLDVSTETVTLNGRRYPGAVGSVTFRCDEGDVAGRVDSLLRLAEFSGVGSFTRKGFGVVEVQRV